MTMFECKTHGWKIIGLTCPHIQEAIRFHTGLPSYFVETGAFMPPVIDLCEPCLEQWKSLPDEGLDGDEKVDQYSDLVPLVPSCGSCIREYAHRRNA